MDERGSVLGEEPVGAPGEAEVAADVVAGLGRVMPVSVQRRTMHWSRAANAPNLMRQRRVGWPARMSAKVLYLAGDQRDRQLSDHTISNTATSSTTTARPPINREHRPFR